MPFSLSRPTAVLAAGVVGASLAAHAWFAVGTGMHVDFVTGVWLTLADDVAHGVFYRDLVGPDGYGGTRYFPLFFLCIGTLMRMGLSPLVSGFLANAFAAALFIAGMRRVLHRLGLPPVIASAVAIFPFAIRFIQEGLLAIRSDVLAAGLLVWGVDFTLSAFNTERPRTRTLSYAAAFFTLGVATKVTSLYAPAAVVLAFLWAARPAAAVRFGGLAAAGIATMLAVVALASDGRAMESWRVAGLAGGGIIEWLGALPFALRTEVIGPSRVFASVLLAATVAWLVMLRARGPALLLVLFPVTIISTTVVLASPGTTHVNQLLDAFAVALMVIGWLVARDARVQLAAMFALLALSLVAAVHCLRPLATADLRQRVEQRAVERAALVREMAAAHGPVLSESPEVLVLGGVRPYLLDPFMLRVLSHERPELLRQLHRDLDARRFSHVILMLDPDGRHGRGWYANVDFGQDVISRICANYELDAVKAGLRVYRPRTGPPAVAELMPLR